jgi:hypothetical protein
MDRAGDHKYDLLNVMSTYFEKEENFVAKGDY